MSNKEQDHIAPSPPRLFLRFFYWFCHPSLHVYIEGDLLELYQERVETLGKRKADKRFAIDVLLLFRPNIIKPLQGFNTLTHYDMIQNYFKIAVRSFLRKKIYSIINILGLSIGITCCLLIFQYVAFEYSFDTFNKNASNIYRVNQTSIRSGVEPTPRANTGRGMAPALADEVPEVINFVRLHPEYGSAIIANPSLPDKAFEEAGVYYVDSSFFQVFSYTLISGNPDHILADPETIVISESIAKKYFGNKDPIGKTLDVRSWISGKFRVDGIFKDVPDNSHLQFDILLPMAGLLTKNNQYRDASTASGWGWTNFFTYVQLQEGADITKVNQKFTEVFVNARKEHFEKTNTSGYLSSQSLLDIHLNESISAPTVAMGSSRTVYFFSIIGLITLLIAFVNYMNLATARALDRAHEVGLRKVIGAKRNQLITQFLTESALTMLVAFAVAILLANTLKPIIGNFTGINLTNDLWMNQQFWFILLISFCISTLLAGFYPAIMLSYFKPIKVLKGKGSGNSKSYLRHALVILQFTASIVLLVSTSIVYKQLNYMRNMDLGIDLTQIMTVSAPRILPENFRQSEAVNIFSQKLLELPAVHQTAASATLPGKGFSFYTSNIRKAGTDASTNIYGAGTYIDSSFISLYGLEVIAGEGFKNISLPVPKDEPNPILANETALGMLGFGTPYEALHEEIIIGGNEYQIVGILKDFNWSSAHHNIETAFFILQPGNANISIKVNTNNLAQTIASAEVQYKQLFPGNPFQYSFADETFAAQYRNDQRFAKLFGLFAALAIFIACLGLFGLAAFTAQKRTKEIGIRKVVGATVPHIIILLSTDFLKLVIIGLLLAIPIAWYSMSRWLEDFAFQIKIDPEVFLLAGFTVVLIALLTVSWQSIKVAVMNPVDSLKNE
ncbi:MAG: ABC transporter permease [Bacteroidota bacterium]